MKAYCITTDETSERFTGFSDSAAQVGLEFETVQGVDGSSLTADSPEAKQVGVFPGFLKGMLACTIAHLRLWEKIVDDGDGGSFVFEDDARILPDLFDASAIETKASESGNGLLVLHVNSFFGDAVIDEYGLTSIPRASASSCAYYLAPGGAAKLLRHCRRDSPPPEGVPANPDGTWHYVVNAVNVFLERVARSRSLGVKIVVPQPVAHSGMESTITTSDYLIPPPVPAPIPFPAKKAKALRSLEDETSALEREGIPVAGESVKLACASSDQDAFSRLLVLLREGEMSQPDQTSKDAFLASEQTVTDVAGAPHTFENVAALRAALLEYGSVLRSHWNMKATKRAAIEAATDETELDAALAG